MSHFRRGKGGRKPYTPFLVILAILLFLAAVFLVGKWLEDRSLKPEARGDIKEHYAYEKTIDYNGQTYHLRSNVTAFLLMGIDHDSDSTVTVRNRSGGRADFLRLLVLDGEKRTITQVPIDRDTMTDVVTLGVLGDRAGKRNMQISLSHYYGNGGEDSCDLTAEAVSGLLLDTPITWYFALNMDGINALNTALGGVTVTVEDDLSHLDPAMTPGATVTLQGDQAETFVRSRMSVGDGTNAARMKRQHEYVSKAMEQATAKLKEDPNYVGEIYDAVEPYITSNVGRGRLVNESYASRNYEVLPECSIEGTHQIGEDGYMEFHPDPDALKQLVLQLFYEPI